MIYVSMRLLPITNLFVKKELRSFSFAFMKQFNTHVVKRYKKNALWYLQLFYHWLIATFFYLRSIDITSIKPTNALFILCYGNGTSFQSTDYVAHNKEKDNSTLPFFYLNAEKRSSVNAQQRASLTNKFPLYDSRTYISYMCALWRCTSTHKPFLFLLFIHSKLVEAILTVSLPCHAQRLQLI
jgi:hypothetical protein